MPYKREPASSSSPGLDGGTTERSRGSIEAWVRFVAPQSHPDQLSEAGPPLREARPPFWCETIVGLAMSPSESLSIGSKSTSIFKPLR